MKTSLHLIRARLENSIYEMTAQYPPNSTSQRSEVLSFHSWTPAKGSSRLRAIDSAIGTPGSERASFILFLICGLGNPVKGNFNAGKTLKWPFSDAASA